jgi:hypothetical protein
LIDNGADINLKNSSKKIAADILLERQKVEMMDIVEKKRGISLETLKGLSQGVLREKI